MFKKLKQFVALKRLRAVARSDPSPTTLAALAERYIAAGRLDEAFRAAQEGMTRFPTSERLAKICMFAKRHRLQDEISRLTHELAERPSPAVYGRLAEIYRELGKHDQAMAMCEKCIERFPLNETPYLTIGEVRLSRFLSDLIAHDGIEAETQLRRVVKLNARNVRAQTLLAQLYYLIGALDQMTHHLKTIITISPAHQDIEKFLSEVPALAQQRPEGEGEEFDEDLAVPELIRAVEARGEFRFPPERFPGGKSHGALGAAHLNMEKLKRGISTIGGSAGVQNAVIVDRSGETLADHGVANSLTGAQFGEMVAAIVKTSESTSRRMDFGTFQWCTVEGEFGGLSIARAQSLSVGMRFEPGMKPERARSLIEEFTARSLTGAREVAGA